MEYSRRRWVAGTIAWGFVAILLHSWLRDSAGDLPLPYVDAVGFSIFVPAFVMLGAVMLPAFEFVRYRRHRGNVGLAIDIVLVVAAGLTGGLAVAFLVTQFEIIVALAVPAVALAVYAAAFAVFTARNLEYYDRYKSPFPG